MALDKDIILKDLLTVKLQTKVNSVKSFERILSDYDGKIGDPKWFILAENDLYFVDDRKRNIVFVTNLHNVCKLEIIPTPNNLGLSDAHRIEVTIQIFYDTTKSREDNIISGETAELIRNENNKVVDTKPLSVEVTDSNDVNALDQPQPAISNKKSSRCCSFGKAEQNVANDTSNANLVSVNGNSVKDGKHVDFHTNSLTELNKHNSSLQTVVIPTAVVKEVDNNGIASFLLFCGYFGRSSCYLHLRNAWQMTVLKRTMLQDIEFVEIVTPRAPSSTSPDMFLSPHSIPEHELSRLFTSLRHDILASKGNFQHLFKTVYELKLALDRQYPIKKFFWDSEDLFNYLVRILGDYLPRQPHLDTPVQFRIQELDMCVLLFQVLSAVFQDTNYLQTRDKVLKFEQGQKIQKLIRLCGIKIHTNITDFSYNPSNAQIEHRLIEEILTEKAAFLYYLLSYLRGVNNSIAQIQMMNNNRSVLSELRVLQLLSMELGFMDTLHDFVKYLSYQISNTVAIPVVGEDTKDSHVSNHSYMKPLLAVKLYYVVYVLAAVIEHDDAKRAALASKYCEEFKFFLHPDRIEQCLKPTLPIRDTLIKLVLRVRDLIVL